MNISTSIHQQLEIKNLSCARNDTVLFDSLSFSLERGQALFIEGSNGSGKTTLLRTLCGFHRQDDGEILWCNNAVDDSASNFYQQISYIGHKNAIKNELSAEENIAMICQLEQRPADQAYEILKTLGLEAHADRYARELSAGQRRRLALSRLLISQRPLWILDEPFTSLDTSSVRFFEQQISKHIRNGGMLIMTAHHDLQLDELELIRLKLEMAIC